MFLPTYELQQFSSVLPAQSPKVPFRVLYAGRIECNKGIYDVISIAQGLEAQCPGRFHFDICGDGSQLPAVQQRILESMLEGVVTCYGFCPRDKLFSIMSAADAVIVPSRKDCEEGFAMICAEAILAGRPVITSAVCPALETIRPAAIEVPPDDVEAYSRAIMSLATDSTLYDEKRRACQDLKEQFYNVQNSWGAKLKEALQLPPLLS